MDLDSLKLLMLIKTAGLEYDDRLRKEVASAQEYGICVEIVALEYRNEAGSRFVYGGVPAHTLRLRSRDWFRRGKGIILKTCEMYWKLLVQILRHRSEIVWAHNLEMSGLILALIVLRKFGVVKRIIWDQHELPPDASLSNATYLFVYRFLMNCCDHVVMASEERRKLVFKKMKGLSVEIAVLHNYPDECFRCVPRQALPETIIEWLGGKAYLLAQGGASPGRHFEELAEAVMRQSTVKLIVVGPYQDHQLESLECRYGEGWSETILFSGLVPQLEMVPYIDHAAGSIIFYTMKKSNTRWCAPNRLYQPLARGVPVIVGRNGPMRRVVEGLGVGVVVDHCDPHSIVNGISLFVEKREKYRQRVVCSASRFRWETQMARVGGVLGVGRRSRGEGISSVLTGLDSPSTGRSGHSSPD